MNVLLVTALVAGGVGRHVEMLAQGLRRRGHRVVVACPSSVAAQFDLGEPVVDLPSGARPHPLRDRRTLATLRATMKGADVVHAHGLRAGALAALARGVPPAEHPRLVVTTHNGPPEGRGARAAYSVMEHLVARGADVVLGVSPDLLDRARAMGAARTGLAVVPAAGGSAADLQLRAAHRPRTRARVRDELGLGDGPEPLLIVNAGRLARQKDQLSLVHAYLQLCDRDTVGRPALVIAGEGPERTLLENALSTAHASTDVRLLGHRSDVPDLLAAADLVVSSARWEGQPVWLQEALQQGAPIVATEVGGTGVLLGDGALLVPGERAGLVDRLAGAMEQVLADEDLRRDLTDRALARARALPTAEDAVDAALAAYTPDMPGADTGPSVT